jgi:hypothetical protein
MLITVTIREPIINGIAMLSEKETEHRNVWCKLIGMVLICESTLFSKIVVWF